MLRGVICKEFRDQGLLLAVERSGGQMLKAFVDPFEQGLPPERRVLLGPPKRVEQRKPIIKKNAEEAIVRHPRGGQGSTISSLL